RSLSFCRVSPPGAADRGPPRAARILIFGTASVGLRDTLRHSYRVARPERHALKVCRAVRRSPTDHARRNARDRRVVRHIVDNHRVRTDACVRTDDDRPDDLGPSPDEDVVPKTRAAPAFGADCHLVFDTDVGTRLDLTVDHDTHRVDQYEPGTELGASADDAASRQDVEFVAEPLERREAMSPCPLHHPIPEHGT